MEYIWWPELKLSAPLIGCEMSDSPLEEARKEQRIEEEIMDEGRTRPRAKVLREKGFLEQVKRQACQQG